MLFGFSCIAISLIKWSLSNPSFQQSLAYFENFSRYQMQTMRKKTFNIWSNGRSLYKWRVFEKRFQNILYKFLVEYSFSPFFLGGGVLMVFFLNFGVLLFSFFKFILLLVYFPVRLFVCFCGCCCPCEIFVTCCL